MREIEIKFKVKDQGELLRRLEARGCVLSTPVRQHDINYAHGGFDEWASAKEGDIMPRIRYEDNHAEFNVKQMRSTEMDNLEHETGVTDPKAMHDILLLLGWSQGIEVTKVRRTGKIDGYEICLDEVEQLGTYLEIEKLTDDDADPEEVRTELLGVAASLGLSTDDEEIRGYDTQIYQLTHQ